MGDSYGYLMLCVFGIAAAAVFIALVWRGRS